MSEHPETSQHAQQPSFEPAYGYPPPPGYGHPPMQRGTNVLAVIALVMSFTFAPAGIVCGVIARRQIRETEEEGHGLATAGMWVGIAFTSVWVLIVLFYIVMMLVIYLSLGASTP